VVSEMSAHFLLPGVCVCVLCVCVCVCDDNKDDDDDDVFCVFVVCVL
jgi:hypothetical protein